LTRPAERRGATADSRRKLAEPTDLLDAPATVLATLVRARLVSAEEVTKAYLARVESVNARLNAIVTLSPNALRDARAVDKRLSDGADPGRLAGIPFTVKDTLATAGLRTSAGSPLLADLIPRESAPAVSRVQEAGAVLLGKTNCAEFGLDIDTVNELFGATINPLNPDLTPGGSSGGESAAACAQLSSFGIGTDFGGSIRWPAQCTGVVSLRPTVGRVPLTGLLPYFDADGCRPPDPLSFYSQASVIAPIGRHFADLWEALAVMAGPDGFDASAVPASLEAATDIGAVPLRAAWLAGEGTYPVRSDVRETLLKAVQALEVAGCHVVEAPVKLLEGAERTYDQLRTADNGSWMNQVPRKKGDRWPDAVEAALRTSQDQTLRQFQDASAERARIRHRVFAFLEDFPILIMPVSAIPAFRREQTEFRVDGVEIPRMGIIACCRAVAFLGLPAASVPCGAAMDGAIISVQIVGRPFAEHQVLVVASALRDAFETLVPQYSVAGDLG